MDCDRKKIEEDIILRDKQDMNREISPLKQAEDAVYVDSSDMTIDEVVQEIITLAKGEAYDGNTGKNSRILLWGKESGRDGLYGGTERKTGLYPWTDHP